MSDVVATPFANEAFLINATAKASLSDVHRFKAIIPEVHKAAAIGLLLAFLPLEGMTQLQAPVPAWLMQHSMSCGTSRMKPTLRTSSRRHRVWIPAETTT